VSMIDFTHQKQRTPWC